MKEEEKEVYEKLIKDLMLDKIDFEVLEPKVVEEVKNEIINTWNHKTTETMEDIIKRQVEEIYYGGVIDKEIKEIIRGVMVDKFKGMKIFFD